MPCESDRECQAITAERDRLRGDLAYIKSDRMRVIDERTKAEDRMLELKKKLEVAEQQIRDLVDAFDKALDHLQTRECEHSGDYASCQREIEATVESHRTHDLRKPPAPHPSEPKCICNVARRITICPVHPFTIFLNGWHHPVGPRLSYEDVVRMSTLKGASLYTVTYCILGENRGGTLTPGHAVKVKGNMSFTVCDTSNA